MLRTDQQVAVINSVNMRAEQHGDNPVPACDINLSFETTAKVLNGFDKDLREALYVEEEPRNGQRRVPGTGKDDPLEGPRYRFSGVLGPLPIRKEWPGYKVGIIFGDIASSVEIDMSEVKVCKIKAEPKDGGTCGIALQLQCHPQKDVYGDLALILQKEVKLTLTPPTASELKKLEKAARKDDGPADD